MPFGIYTEIYDVGTLRPFLDLPQSIYGPTGFVSESYDGIGLTGSKEGDSGWELAWNVYAGGVKLEVSEPFEEAAESEDDEAEAAEESLENAEGDLENVLGAQLLISTPVEGLSFGFSAYAGEPEIAGDLAEGEVSWGDVKSFGLQLEYLAGPVSLRTEAGQHQESEFDTDSAYLELAYMLNDHWQLAGRVESIAIDFLEELPTEAQSLLEHDEIAIGINYWLSPAMVIKLSYHQVDGNLFASPEEEDELREAIEEGTLDGSTDLITLGVQFSF